MKSIRSIIAFLVPFTIAFVQWQCANPVSPTGGPKDETPPKMLEAEPPMFTTNFSTDKVRIYFDEYIQLKELTQQLIISPPMDERPEIKLKGKSVVIEFQEELKENTTYNIFFGDAIVDLTENNPASNFQYIFSTGDVLDSLSLKGVVKDAFNLAPVPDLNVMLYLDNSDTIPYDSLPYFVKPYYYSRTDENGDFQFYNLMDQTFKIFVLEDANSNMLFDQVTERIAYADSLLVPYFIPPPARPDTVTDSLGIPLADSLVFELPDTLPPIKEPEPLPLFLFREVDSVQRLIKGVVVKTGKLMFVFKERAHSPVIKALNIAEELDWKIEEFNQTRDTLSIWIKEDIPDTVTFVVSDRDKVLDTIKMSTQQKYKNKREREKALEEGPKKLNFKFAKNTALNEPLKVRYSYPIRSYDIRGSLLVENEDTLVPEFSIADSIGLYGEVSHKWIENSSYSLLIPDSAFTGLGGQTHDTIRHNFRTKALADYGNLFIDVVVGDIGTNHIIQLMKKETILKQFMVKQDTRLRFEYLLPGDYTIKLIVDKNDNKRWDTGHYMLGIQPEKVFYFPNVITIRANWDVEEKWSF